jgi:hypothetical protein
MWLVLFLVVLLVTQIVFLILGLGHVVDWSIWVLASPVLIFIGMFLFFFVCRMINAAIPTKRVIESDRIGIDSDTSAEQIARMIQNGYITLDNVLPEDKAEVMEHLPAQFIPRKPSGRSYLDIPLPRR